MSKAEKKDTSLETIAKEVETASKSALIDGHPYIWNKNTSLLEKAENISEYAPLLIDQDRYTQLKKKKTLSGAEKGEREFFDSIDTKVITPVQKYLEAINKKASAAFKSIEKITGKTILPAGISETIQRRVYTNMETVKAALATEFETLVKDGEQRARDRGVGTAVLQDIKKHIEEKKKHAEELLAKTVAVTSSTFDKTQIENAGTGAAEIAVTSEWEKELPGIATTFEKAQAVWEGGNIIADIGTLEKTLSSRSHTEIQNEITNSIRPRVEALAKTKISKPELKKITDVIKKLEESLDISGEEQEKKNIFFRSEIDKILGSTVAVSNKTIEELSQRIQNEATTEKTKLMGDLAEASLHNKGLAKKEIGELELEIREAEMKGSFDDVARPAAILERITILSEIEPGAGASVIKTRIEEIERREVVKEKEKQEAIKKIGDIVDRIKTIRDNIELGPNDEMEIEKILSEIETSQPTLKSIVEQTRTTFGEAKTWVLEQQSSKELRRQIDLIFDDLKNPAHMKEGLFPMSSLVELQELISKLPESNNIEKTLKNTNEQLRNQLKDEAIKKIGVMDQQVEKALSTLNPGTTEAEIETLRKTIEALEYACEGTTLLDTKPMREKFDQFMNLKGHEKTLERLATGIEATRKEIEAEKTAYEKLMSEIAELEKAIAQDEKDVASLNEKIDGIETISNDDLEIDVENLLGVALTGQPVKVTDVTITGTTDSLLMSVKLEGAGAKGLFVDPSKIEGYIINNGSEIIIDQTRLTISGDSNVKKQLTPESMATFGPMLKTFFESKDTKKGSVKKMYIKDGVLKVQFDKN